MTMYVNIGDTARVTMDIYYPINFPLLLSPASLTGNSGNSVEVTTAIPPFFPSPVMIGMGHEIQCWRVESISGSTIRLIRVSGTEHLEDAIAPSSQTPSALSNFELCEFEKEIVSFQFDCLQV